MAAEGTKFRAMTSFRRAAVCLALVAMMLRGLMPAGWMPNPDGAGTSLFVICDMDQADMSKMDMSHMDMSAMDHAPAHKPSSNSHQHEACPRTRHLQQHPLEAIAGPDAYAISGRQAQAGQASCRPVDLPVKFAP